MSDPNADSQAYVWNWFALHSGQRMQLVNFWLVAVAFLGAAFVQARSGNLRPVAAGVCAVGAVASVAFAMLDARTRQLVQVAEAALRTLEQQRTSAGADEAMQLVLASHVARSSRVLSYRVIIQSLQIVVAVLFAVACVFTIAGG